MEAAKEKGEPSEAASREGESSLEELLRSLNLKGEDIKGVFVAKSEVESLKEEVKWRAVMRLLTSKPFSAISLKKPMNFAWAPAKEVTFRDLEGQIFLV
jgi:Mg2+/Co2+ transporter CorB